MRDCNTFLEWALFGMMVMCLERLKRLCAQRGTPGRWEDSEPLEPQWGPECKVSRWRR